MATSGVAPMRAAEAAPAARRNVKRKGSDHQHAGARVTHSIPESPMFTSLLALERQLDAVIKRRRMEAQDAELRPVPLPKVLRLYLFNTHTVIKDGAGKDLPTWCFCMHGRVLDPQEAAGGAPPPPHLAGPHNTQLRMTNFLRKVEVAFTPAEAAGPTTPAEAAGGGKGSAGAAGATTTPAGAVAGAAGGKGSTGAPGATKPSTAAAAAAGGAGAPTTSAVGGGAAAGEQEGSTALPRTLTWVNPAVKGGAKDMLQVYGQGTQPLHVKVKLDIDWQPARYRIPPGLAQLLGVQFDTKARLLAALWTHVQMKGLQSKEDPSQLQLDGPLSKLLNRSSLPLAGLPEALYAVLAPMEPIQLEYTLQLSGPSPAAPACYDIQVAAPLPKAKTKVLDNVNMETELSRCDEWLSSISAQLAEHQRRRTFFLGFAAAPVEFINAIIASQARDLHVVAGQPGMTPLYDAMTRTEFFRGPWVEEAALKFMERSLVPRQVPPPPAAAAAGGGMVGVAGYGAGAAGGVGPGAAGLHLQQQQHQLQQMAAQRAAAAHQQALRMQQQQQQQQQHQQQQVAAQQAAAQAQQAAAQAAAAVVAQQHQQQVRQQQQQATAAAAAATPPGPAAAAAGGQA